MAHKIGFLPMHAPTTAPLATGFSISKAFLGPFETQEPARVTSNAYRSALLDPPELLVTLMLIRANWELGFCYHAPSSAAILTLRLRLRSQRCRWHLRFWTNCRPFLAGLRSWSSNLIETYVTPSKDTMAGLAPAFQRTPSLFPTTLLEDIVSMVEVAGTAPASQIRLSSPMYNHIVSFS